MNLKEEINDILGLIQKQSINEAELNNRKEYVREQIRNGNSTGDPITDFVTVYHFPPLPETEQPYRTLQRRLEGRQDSQVLAISQHAIYDTAISYFPRGIRRDSLEHVLQMGILTSGLELNIKNGDVVLLTGNHVLKNNEFSDDWRLYDGPIKINCFEMPFLDKKMSDEEFMIRKNNDFKFGLSVLVGPDVAQHFRKEGWARGKYLDFSYPVALKMLGRYDETPEDFRRGYEKKIFGRKVDLIQKIESLMESIPGHEKRIKAIYDSIKSGGLVEGASIVPVEDEDDAKILSIGHRKEIEESEDEIKRYLKQALGLEMHRGEWVIENHRGVPGLSLNVPEFTRGLCHYYGLEIPK